MTKCRTDGTSAFNTRTTRRRLPRLDPARREGEVEEDSIQQQHNGVVVMEERGNSAGLRQAPQKRRKRDAGLRHQQERNSCLWSPKTPTIYRGKGGAAPP